MPLREASAGGGGDRPRSVAVILNPRAGSPQSRLTLAAASQLLARFGFDVEGFVTTRPGEASELAARAAAAHPVVAAVGGDGTVCEVATGLLGASAALAVLPTGSGNDFASGLGIATPEAGAVAAARGCPRRLDVAYLDRRPFFNSAGFFLSGLVSQRAVCFWRRAGRWRYVLAAMTAMPCYRPQPAVWRLEGEPEVRAGRWMLTEIGNGPRAGGGFMLLPDADPSDGWLDFCLVAPLSLWTLARLFPAAARGEQLAHPAIARPRARRATLSLERRTPIHVDGEPTVLEPGRYEVRLDPGRLAVLAPAPGDSGRVDSTPAKEDRGEIA
jgi:diacylglycerol kinase (ATP)